MDAIFAKVTKFYPVGAWQIPVGSAIVTIFYRFSSPFAWERQRRRK
jgi:hypothetical protein